MKFLRWLNANKTKMTGLLLVLIGSLQANSSAIQQLLTPEQYAWLTVALGLLVALLGFLNNPK
jgi:hypothetical protein